MIINAIEIKNLSKEFDLSFENNVRTLRTKFDQILHKPFSLLKNEPRPYKSKTCFHALTDINLTVKNGETIGIIGPNGSGKSTLLQILAGIIAPTSGKININGKIGSLLEVGAGFNSELTGRENVYLSGAILGIPHKMILAKFNEIVEFSEIGSFIDIPVKKYSSGMYVRLAFSITIQLNTDILLIDEVLSVGDAEFQEKSLTKMEEVSRQNRKTIVMVSHNLDTIRKLCDRVCFLKNGEIQKLGGALDTVNYYLSSVNAEIEQQYRVSSVRGPMHILFQKIADEKVTEDTKVFFRPEAKVINTARMDHLDSLNLPLNNKRILDVGCGVGILADHLYKKSPQITCIDGRNENISYLKKHFPHLKNSTFLFDVDCDDLTPLGIFDIIFCYGLLYHIEKPDQLLEKLSRLSSGMLLLESCITDFPEPLNLWVEETSAYNQAIKGIGSRPTPSFIISALHKNGFLYVYFPKIAPKHPDFSFSYSGSFRNILHNHPLRQIFIASKKPLENPRLVLVSYAGNTNNPNQKSGSDILSSYSKSKLLKLAADTYKPLPQIPYPGWLLGASENNPDRTIFKHIWEEINKRYKNEQINFQVNWIRNLKINLYTGDEICRALYVEGCYEPNELYFLSQYLKPGMTFVDVGANLGVYSLVAAKLTGEIGKVISIEPSVREYSRLVKNIKLNNLTNITVFNVGIAEKPVKTVPFHVAAYNHAGHNSLGNFAYPGIQLDKMQIINLDNLDNLIEKQNINKVDVIKMDIEGAELKALKGAKNILKRDKPVIFLELSDKALKQQNTTSVKIRKYLESLSYQICHFDKNTGLLNKKSKLTKILNENVIAAPIYKITQFL